MPIRSFAALVLAFALPSVVAAAPPGQGSETYPGFDVNKDLRNDGSIAHDVAIVLEGTEDVIDFMNGHSPFGFSTIPGVFNPPTESVVNGNTVIHWQYFSDGNDFTIDPGQTIHVGYTTADHNSKVLDIYWTNSKGNRLFGSIVYDATAKVTHNSRFGWILEGAYAEQTKVSNIRYAVLPSPMPLPDLGRDNQELTAALHSIEGEIILAAGESTTVEPPVEPAPGSAVVLVYEVSGPGSHGVVTNFVQTVIPVPVTDDSGDSSAATGPVGKQ